MIRRAAGPRANEFAATTSRCPPARTNRHRESAGAMPASTAPAPRGPSCPANCAGEREDFGRGRIDRAGSGAPLPPAPSPLVPRGEGENFTRARPPFLAWHSPVTDSPRRRTSCRRCGEFIRSAGTSPVAGCSPGRVQCRQRMTGTPPPSSSSRHPVIRHALAPDRIVQPVAGQSSSHWLDGRAAPNVARRGGLRAAGVPPRGTGRAALAHRIHAPKNRPPGAPIASRTATSA
jgi:hypothetical protein